MSIILSVFPLILSLLPGLCGVAVGDAIDRVVADTVLLTIVAWALYKLSSLCAHFYVNASNEYRNIVPEVSKKLHSDEQVVKLLAYCLGLVLYVCTPIIGAVILLQAREWLFTGSQVANNLNVPIYLGAGWIIIVNRLSPAEGSEFYDRRRIDRGHNQRKDEIESLKLSLSGIKRELTSLETKLVNLNNVTQGHIYTTWKASDKLAHVMKSIPCEPIQRNHQIKSVNKYALNEVPHNMMSPSPLESGRSNSPVSLGSVISIFENPQYHSSVRVFMRNFKLWCKLLVASQDGVEPEVEQYFSQPSTSVINQDTIF
jgi:hypothetical protein